MTSPTALPEPVRDTVDAYLALVDGAAPGLVEELHLVGSLGFGEWHAARSDVDFVAVLAERPDAAAAEVFGTALKQLAARRPKPHFDGLHIARADLAAPPSRAPGLPAVLAWDFRPEGRFGLDPVTWHELARHSIPVRGRRLTEAQVWTDDAALRAYTRENLTAYWQPKAEEVRAARDRALAGDTTAFFVDWFALGPARLHHLLATGRLTTKDGAGRHALAAFDARWHPIVHEALRLRSGGTGCAYEGGPGPRLDAALDLADTVIAAALELDA